MVPQAEQGVSDEASDRGWVTGVSAPVLACEPPVLPLSTALQWAVRMGERKLILAAGGSEPRFDTSKRRPETGRFRGYQVLSSRFWQSLFARYPFYSETGVQTPRFTRNRRFCRFRETSYR